LNQGPVEICDRVGFPQKNRLSTLKSNRGGLKKKGFTKREKKKHPDGRSLSALVLAGEWIAGQKFVLFRKNWLEIKGEGGELQKSGVVRRYYHGCLGKCTGCWTCEVKDDASTAVGWLEKK